MNDHKKSFKILKGKNFYKIFIGNYDEFVKEKKSDKNFFKPIFNGITKRWLINSFGLMFAILIIVEIIISIIIREFFYTGIQQSINGRSNELANVLIGYSYRQNQDFVTTARKYVEDFPDKRFMELTAFDDTNNIITTSTGFELDHEQGNVECEKAKRSLSKSHIWIGKLASGEKVMAITRALYNTSSIYMGSIRYSVSLEGADAAIRSSILVSIIVGLFIVTFMLTLSIYFIRSMVVPIRDISTAAKKVAHGDFKSRIHINRKYDDEISELCNTINYMANELSTSEQMKNDFISSVSHELRTPLTAIKGWAETMQMDLTSDPEMIDKGMNVIINESERLCGLVEELLDFSRIQSGRMVLVMERIDVLAELTEAVYMFRNRAKTERKNLLYTEPQSISPVIGDKNRLRQVFINIIDNALKYTEENGTLNIRILEDDKTISVIISDDGCGIPEEHLPRVKDKFYKANQTQRGSGIGLAVADEIIKLHRGTLEIVSKENVGTTVEIKLPIAEKIDDSQ